MKKSFSIYSIAELYNHKSESAHHSISVGRLFKSHNSLGLFDATGIVWPIHFETAKQNFKQGDVLKFKYTFKSDTLCIEDILDYVEQKEQWKNKSISSPIDFDDSFLKVNKRNPQKTKYFVHPTLSKRIKSLKQRSKAITFTRKFFEKQNFFYAETPTLVRSGGMESYLHTFQTEYHDFQGRSWTFELPTSPEFALKKLLAEGFPNVFQVARSFRNHGEKSDLHEPEFFMLEWYRAGGVLEDILQDTQEFVSLLAKYLKSTKSIPTNWPQYSVKDLFLTHLNLNLDQLQETKDFYEQSKIHSVSLRETDSWDDIFCKLFMEKIEPFLKEQTACFVTDYPSQMGALAQLHPENPLYVQRAEAYLFGVEISNGYQELVEAVEFEARLAATQAKRNGQIKHDFEFENAMKFGLPPCAGNALGLDRVIALLLGHDNIQKLLLFPF